MGDNNDDSSIAQGTAVEYGWLTPRRNPIVSRQSQGAAQRLCLAQLDAKGDPPTRATAAARTLDALYDDMRRA